MSTQQPPISIRLIQATSILIPTLTSGSSLALSTLLTPRLLESPTPLMLHQWANNHRVTSRIFPVLSTLSTALYLTLALCHSRYYSTAANAKGWKLYLAAGLLCFSATPYTWAFMIPLNRRILRKAEGMRGLEGLGAAEVEAMDLEEEGVGPRGEEGAKWLVDQWGLWNLGRVVVWGVAGVLGLAATV
ncbi:hypothetical protein VMCG_08677 [Cytospora schulzeri]|uniref:DUF1772 domain-containing protein n=1 Tax=Cytospora schulzeri TaxID=448051 RepID=A0A423VTG6_9PEZI|nr:hypothetical protein VMCG_08677 [Valsa malicola]